MKILKKIDNVKRNIKKWCHRQLQRIKLYRYNKGGIWWELKHPLDGSYVRWMHVEVGNVDDLKRDVHLSKNFMITKFEQYTKDSNIKLKDEDGQLLKAIKEGVFADVFEDDGETEYEFGNEINQIIISV